MPLSASPWWCTAETSPGPSSTYPSQIFCAPTVFSAIAASRSIAPLAWSGQRSADRITRSVPLVAVCVFGSVLVMGAQVLSFSRRLEHYPPTQTREARASMGGELLATWVAVLVGCVLS